MGNRKGKVKGDGNANMMRNDLRPRISPLSHKGNQSTAVVCEFSAER